MRKLLKTAKSKGEKIIDEEKLEFLKTVVALNNKFQIFYLCNQC